MATKTISIDLDAYERLRRARRSPSESFSRVIKRARWDAEDKTCGSFLRALRTLPRVAEEVLDELDARQEADASPADPWNR